MRECPASVGAEERWGRWGGEGVGSETKRAIGETTWRWSRRIMTNLAVDEELRNVWVALKKALHHAVVRPIVDAKEMLDL